MIDIGVSLLHCFTCRSDLDIKMIPYISDSEKKRVCPKCGDMNCDWLAVDMDVFGLTAIDEREEV